MCRSLSDGLACLFTVYLTRYFIAILLSVLAYKRDVSLFPSKIFRRPTKESGIIELSLKVIKRSSDSTKKKENRFSKNKEEPLDGYSSMSLF